MKLQVKLTAKDLWQFMLYHSNKGFMGLFNIIFSAAAIFLLVTTWGTTAVSHKVMLAICALMFTVWQPALLWGKSKRQSMKPAVKEPMEMEFTEKGIKISQAGQTSEAPWENLTKIIRTPHLVIMYMDRIHAYLLPKHILGDKEAEFYEILKEHMPKERLKGFKNV